MFIYLFIYLSIYAFIYVFYLFSCVYLFVDLYIIYYNNLFTKTGISHDSHQLFLQGNDSPFPPPVAGGRLQAVAARGPRGFPVDSGRRPPVSAGKFQN